ncbi:MULTISPECIES: hypothetical protein [unclassified Microcoleus]|uniref:hypothetical protein n=1 Tax=unclassified Microcoleus TaxID=2642155 RepID=UPI002FD16B3C
MRSSVAQINAPQENSLFVEQASCLFVTKLQDVRNTKLYLDTPLAEAEGILNSATDLKMFCPCGNS